MLQSLRYYFLPFIFVVLVIGYQICVYFFYIYFKNRDTKRSLNKILLAYGNLIGFGLTGIIFKTINTYYINNQSLSNYLIILSHIFISIGTLSFLTIVAQKQFNQILNITITRVVLIYSITVTILIQIVSDFFSSLLVFISAIIGFVFFTVFHINLIKKLRGSLRKRLILIFLGDIILLVSILIRAKESMVFYNTIIANLIEIVTIPLMIFALNIIFFGILKFPVFLELNWKDNLIKFIVINKRSHDTVYDYEFEELKEAKAEHRLNKEQMELLLSKGLIAVHKILDALIKNDEKVLKIEQGNFIILIEKGDKCFSHFIFLLVVKRNMKTLRYFLETLKNKFQDLYEVIIINNPNELNKNYLGGFEKIINHLL